MAISAPYRNPDGSDRGCIVDGCRNDAASWSDYCPFHDEEIEELECLPGLIGRFVDLLRESIIDPATVEIRSISLDLVGRGLVARISRITEAQVTALAEMRRLAHDAEKELAICIDPLPFSPSREAGILIDLDLF